MLPMVCSDRLPEPPVKLKAGLSKAGERTIRRMRRLIGSSARSPANSPAANSDLAGGEILSMDVSVSGV